MDHIFSGPYSLNCLASMTLSRVYAPASIALQVTGALKTLLQGYIYQGTIAMATIVKSAKVAIMYFYHFGWSEADK
jgi:hypothetical protein